MRRQHWIGTLLVGITALASSLSAAEKPHVVIVQGESEYGSQQSMVDYKAALETRLGVRVTVLNSGLGERGMLHDLSVLDEADLLVLFIRFRMASDAQFERLNRWFDQGKPALAFRTTSHGFWERKGWFVPFFGGHYKSHAPNRPGTQVLVSSSQRHHPIARGVERSFHVGYGGTYNAQPLSDFVTPVLFGRTGDLPAEPVAWIAEYRPGQRLFYTSLGAKDNFENRSFQNLILNAAQWALEREVPPGGVLGRDANITQVATENLVAPPVTLSSGDVELIPKGNLDAWQHWDPSVAPLAIGLDERADTSSGGPSYSKARWGQDGGSVIARPGFGDIVTKESFADGVFRLDFLIPSDTAGLPRSFRGNSGVFIDGKWELQIVDSYGETELDERNTCGAIFGVAAPMVNACKPAGSWQSLEVSVRHLADGAEISAWLNDRQIHDRVRVRQPTVYGFGSAEVDEDDEDDDEGEMRRVVVFNARASKTARFDRDFTASLRFRTEDDGPLFAKTMERGAFAKGDLAGVVVDGRVRVQLASGNVLQSRTRVDDEDWHELVLQSSGRRWTLYLDGKEEAHVSAVSTRDRDGSRVILGAVSDAFAEDNDDLALWTGEIERFRFYNAVVSLSQLKREMGRKPKLEWLDGANVDQITGKDAKRLNFGRDFSALVRFRTEEDGPLWSKAPEKGQWAPDGKVLFVDGGRLVYDIGWLGALGGGKAVDDGEWHVAVVTHSDGNTKLFLDGKLIDEAEDFGRPDDKAHIVKVGSCSSDFPEGAFRSFPGAISHFGFKSNAVTAKSAGRMDVGKVKPVDWKVWRQYDDVQPRNYQVVYREDQESDEEDEEVVEQASPGPTGGGPLRLQADSAAVRFANVTVAPLGDIDHAGIISGWNEETLVRGQRVYDAICITCHGNLEKEGSLPTSRKFWEAEFKNGKDPYRLFETLGDGYQQMPAFPFLTVQQRYDVIHYLREALVKPTNGKEYFPVTDEYLASLPKGTSLTGEMTAEMLEYAKGPKYRRMNFGPMLDWTYQVAPDNIAYKAIAVRLDSGAGGVSRGRAWQVFDHDTLRMAAGWSGKDFIDWKGIALDQSHGTHASIVGDIAFVNPVGPGWANPRTGSWDDPRFLGRDGKPYGPLPRDWAQFRGQYLHGDNVVIHYTVGDATVLELAGMELSDANVVYTRTLNVGESSHDLQLRLCPDDVSAVVAGTAGVAAEVLDGYQVVRISASATPINFKVLVGKVEAAKLGFQAMVAAPPEDLRQYLKGGPARFPEVVVTEGINGGDDEAFVVDEIRYPDENPWESWMRIGGFDFLPGGKRAAVATWLGDVWLVDGIDGRLSKHNWKRICTGLFQPLGVKVVDGLIYVTCRDQIARLHDYNGDEEIDYVEAFNSDHQVTEHFHEFAMGLQTDSAGNFYYAKSARHAKTAIVPHHGTLLRVSADGQKTEILAVGFRAANGVCLNPDGSFIVTDQEGHWNPKNRINYVREGGFYGNMMGYHSVVDERDEAMEQPLCWITNAFDRSPGELLWVPENAAWGALKGQLLNMSYGTGQVFVVPHEIVNGQAQGGMLSLGLEFPTGTMRGRFHESNGQLYSTGMFAWAGNKHQDGGFYRIRYTGKAAHQVTALRAMREGIELTLTDPVDSRSAMEVANYGIKIWDLKRTKNYGSRHYNERPLEIERVELSRDRKQIFLRIPEITTTWGMEIKMNLKGENGEPVNRVIHNTIHHLQNTVIF